MLEIRQPRLDEYDDYARLFVELGVDDAVPDRRRFAADLRERMFVAVRDATIVGYAFYERLADVGYVRNLVSAPQHRRQGVGRCLMEHLRRIFEDEGVTAWCLNVMPTNEPAVALYRACGLEIAYEAWSLRMPIQTLRLDALPKDLVIGRIAPSDDEALERRFGLIRGQLASARNQRGRDLLVFTSGGAPVGLAVFDASFPGAFPFRLHDKRFALPIAAHFRRCAPSAARWVQLVVEDDTALRDHLLDRGAIAALHFVHMRGQLGTPST